MPGSPVTRVGEFATAGVGCYAQGVVIDLRLIWAAGFGRGVGPGAAVVDCVFIRRRRVVEVIDAAHDGRVK